MEPPGPPGALRSSHTKRDTTHFRGYPGVSLGRPHGPTLPLRLSRMPLGAQGGLEGPWGALGALGALGGPGALGAPGALGGPRAPKGLRLSTIVSLDSVRVVRVRTRLLRPGRGGDVPHLGITQVGTGPGSTTPRASPPTSQPGAPTSPPRVEPCTRAAGQEHGGRGPNFQLSAMWG